jgi:hypothetical protein
LASHASGRRSGDQFCIYVFDRLVLPTLGRQQIQNAARGQLPLDSLTRQLLPDHVGIDPERDRRIGVSHRAATTWTGTPARRSVVA